MANRTKFNLENLIGWSDLSAGVHNITIGAKAQGYTRVIQSQAVSVEKETPPTPVEPTANNDIVFYSNEPFTIKTRNETIGWDGTIEYSTDETTWNTWNGSEISGAVSGEYYVLYFRGTNNLIISGDGSDFRDYSWIATGNSLIYCNGNIETLLDYQTVISSQHPPMANNCFRGMFAYSNIASSPSLPATTLSWKCYQQMFAYDTNLETLPLLPATTLEDECYARMFRGCSNIYLSTTQDVTYSNAYRIPSAGSGVVGYNSMYQMFDSTGGTFTGTPTIDTTYYTSNKLVDTDGLIIGN